MASTFTDIGTELMTTGENAGTWGTKTNTNIQILEEAVNGVVSVSVASADQTLSYTDGALGDVARHAFIAFTGALAGNRTITVPANEKVWIFDNQTTNAQTLTVKVSGQTGVTWGASDKGTKILYANGTDVIDTNIGGSVGGLDLNGEEFILDLDGDTSITADTDDQIDIKIAGTDQLTIKDGALSPVTDNDIDLGTSTLEFKDAFFDGTVTSDAFAGPLTGNVTGNVSGTAATVTTAAQSNITSLGTLTTLTVDNVITNGSNIGHTSDTDLITLADGVVTVAGEVSMTTLDIGGTNVTSTAAELNLVDGITAGTVSASLAVIADSNKDISGFRNVTLTGELDAATGDFSGDVDVDGTLEADAITINGTAIASVLSPVAGGSGIVTTGALNSGSITSGFGTIDTGSSTITTTGLISGGSLDIDNVLINGTTIGHTDDTDLITLADGIATVAGEISVTTLDIGGTNVTATAAELNFVDGGATVGTTAVADGDGIIHNDGGTMKVTSAATFKTYFQDGVTATAIAADNIAVGDAAVTIGNGSTNADVVIDSGADITLDAAGGNIEFKDSGTIQLVLDMDGTAGAQVVQLRVDADDLIFKQFDGTTVLTLDDDTTVKVATDLTVGDDLSLITDSAVLKFGADGDTTLTHTDGTGLTLNSTNKLCFNDATQFIQGASGTVLDIAATDEIELTATLINVVGNLAGSGTGTFGGILKTDDATEATSTTDGSLQTDGGLSVVKDAIFGDDVTLISDAAVLKFGADSEVTLTHVHNDGLLLNTDMQLQFRDSAINIRSDADGDLDINADDEVEINSTLIDINGNVEMSGTLAQAGVATFALAANVAQVALTSSSNAIAWNASAAANAYHLTTENTTFSAPSNAVEGAFIAIEINYNGSHTIAFNTIFEFAASTAPTFTSTDAKTDILVFKYNGAIWQEVGRTINLSES